jgi:hypothetical protein
MEDVIISIMVNWGWLMLKKMTRCRPCSRNDKKYCIWCYKDLVRLVIKEYINILIIYTYNKYLLQGMFL